MLIGEGPGFHEDRSGRPFVGASGNFLTELLASIGIKREDVFIANVVKCRPPGNRDPLPEEIEACREYLDRQIAVIKPRVIVTLGRYSMARWFPSARISRIHGQARQFGELTVVPMFHPAAALHQPTLRQDVEADFKKLPALLSQPAPDGAPPEDSSSEDFEQLSLF
jgi:DNA polymerase